MVVPFPIVLGMPYLEESPDGQYVFIPADPEDFIHHLKQSVATAVGEWFMPLDWDVVAARPHITVGYFTGPSPTLPATIPASTALRWNSVTIAQAGRHGTCDRVLGQVALDSR
jgi:hypothetical protein